MQPIQMADYMVRRLSISSLFMDWRRKLLNCVQYEDPATRSSIWPLKVHKTLGFLRSVFSMFRCLLLYCDRYCIWFIM